MHIFYTPDIDSAPTYTLNEEESHHSVKVMRLQKGAQVRLIDGKGGFFLAELLEPNPKHALLKILDYQYEYERRNHYLHIAIAPTKNIERLEWFLEKATEIGIDEISLLLCDRSERKDVKIERLNKVVVSAIKQSERAYCPKLNDIIKIKSFLEKPLLGQKFIAHCMDTEKFPLIDKIDVSGNYTIMIGPEGDFSSAEIEKSLQSEFLAITLGKNRLRTETAALEACFEINFLNR